MSDDQDEHVANLHRVLGVPMPEKVETNIVDMRTRKPHYVPNALARTLKTISDAFKPGPPKDG